jgi:sugar phosphate isomerase/epimerase
LAFDLQYPARFTGEFQAFVRDRENRNEYGSMEFIESHDMRKGATVSLVPDVRVPPMGYQDDGFDPQQGIGRLGLKISAQSDRVRGAGYRPFRGTIRVAKVRVRDIDRHSDPEIRTPAANSLRPLLPLPPEQFLAASGVDRPWPVGYGFSGPVSDIHLAELERTYAAIAERGCTFTRIYVGDYRTGLQFDGKGKITGVESAFLEYLDRLAETANRHGITVMISLTDNTIADGRGLESVGLIHEGEESQLFVNKVLVEFVKKLSSRQVVWDLFNEPENVTAISLRDIQRYVDRVSAAAKQADGDARLTVVSRSRSEITYWQGRGLDLYSHNIFSKRSLDESLAAPRVLDAPVMVAEMAPELATAENLQRLREAGYSGVGIWGWNTEDKYEWKADDLVRVVAPLVSMAVPSIK